MVAKKKQHKKSKPKPKKARPATTTAAKPRTAETAARLRRLSALCAAFPEAEQRAEFAHASFRVRTKVFAYYLNDHHGDGIVAVATKAAPGQSAELVAAFPKRFYSPPYIGPRGWVGVRLDVDDIDWDQLRALLVASYRATAPAKLAALVAAT